MRELFWERFDLEELTAEEWEALCDGCGQCCLIKFQDEDSGDLAVLGVACELLDIHSCRCSIACGAGICYACRQCHEHGVIIGGIKIDLLHGCWCDTQQSEVCSNICNTAVQGVNNHPIVCSCWCLE